MNDDNVFFSCKKQQFIKERVEILGQFLFQILATWLLKNVTAKVTLPQPASSPMKLR